MLQTVLTILKKAQCSFFNRTESIIFRCRVAACHHTVNENHLTWKTELYVDCVWSHVLKCTKTTHKNACVFKLNTVHPHGATHTARTPPKPKMNRDDQISVQ